MKKSVYIALIMPLVFAACSNNSEDKSGSLDAFLEKWKELKPYQSVCTSVKDAYIFPKDWSRKDLDNYDNLPAEFFHSMSTCGLLKTLLENPENRLGPWCFYCSSIVSGVTRFNDSLKANKAAVELFGRNDCASTLASQYLTLIGENREKNSQTDYFEILLASDMCMKALNAREKVLFMAMALERVYRAKDNSCIPVTCHIMVAILRSCNYAPFLNEFGTEWTEGTTGYTICYTSENGIINYAEQFLNEQK